MGALAATAALIAWDNAHYYWYGGVFYQPYNGGYQAITPPMGAIVPNLPSGAVSLEVGDVNYYYYAGTFFQPLNAGYQIIQAPAGAIVYNLPDGCTSVNAGGITYLQYNGAYFQPIQDADGNNAYEVVAMQ